MTTLFGIKNCDSIKKTCRWLDEHQVEYSFHDYKVLGCPSELAARMLTGVDYLDLINRRSTTWRNLPESSKQALSEATAAQLIQESPTLIKRPLILSNGQWIVGFNEPTMRSLLLTANR